MAPSRLMRSSDGSICHGVLPHRQLHRQPAGHCRRRGDSARAADAATSPNGRRCASASRDFLTPWEPTWPADDLTRGAFRRRLKRYAEDQRNDLAYAFFIFRSDDNALVGGLDARQYPPRRRAGRHHRLLDRRALRAPGLHDRGDARRSSRSASARCGCTGWRRPASRPTPPRSRLLEKTGFQREGYARSYLCINGVWQDHLLYARLKDDPAD